MTPACPLCNHRHLSPVAIDLEGSVTSDNRYLEHRVSNFWCNACGLVFIAEADRLDHSRFYQEGYRFLSLSDEAEPVSPDSVKYTDRLVRLFSPFLKTREAGTLLDIGAGKGNFEEALHRSFPSLVISALEPSRAYHSLKMKTFLREVRNSFFSSRDFDGKVFDFVGLIGVLEHVPSPTAFLIDVGHVMNEQSTLFLEVPNFKNNKADLLTADHFSKFTEECMSNLLSASGFTVIHKNTGPMVPMQFVARKSGRGEIEPFDVAPYVEQAAVYLKRAISEGKKLGGRNVALYGQGLVADYLVGTGIIDKDSVTCVIDDNYLYQGTRWKESVPIISFEEFQRGHDTRDIFLAMNDCYHHAVTPRIPRGYHVWGTL